GARPAAGAAGLRGGHLRARRPARRSGGGLPEPLRGAEPRPERFRGAPGRGPGGAALGPVGPPGRRRSPRPRRRPLLAFRLGGPGRDRPGRKGWPGAVVSDPGLTALPPGARPLPRRGGASVAAGGERAALRTG